METSVKITLIIVAAVFILALIGYSIYYGGSLKDTISVNGQATVKAMPDLVSVYFSVETKGKTAQVAKDSNSEIVEKLIDALIKENFKREEIVTENFNIYPNYNWDDGKQKLVDYRATHSLKVEISTEDTDKIGKAIDAGADAGALINYINFELSQEKQNQYKAEALKEATEDAKIKAEAIASGLGKQVGKIVSVSDSSFDYYPWPIYQARADSTAMEAKADTTSIQPGEQEIQARVSVVFKLR